MKRPVVVGVAIAALVAAASFVWVEVRQEREFRRLIAVGDAALAQDQTFAAIEAFSGALALRPTSMLAYLRRGESYYRRGEFADAERDLEQAAGSSPAAPQPIELLGDVTLATGRAQRAVSLYQRYLQLDDRSPRVLYKLAVAQFRSGAPEPAVQSLEQALSLQEVFPEAHYLLGMTFRALRREGDARRAFMRAIAIDPGFIAAREELAALHADAGRERTAIEQLEAVAALETDRPERLVAVGLRYARIGRLDAAIVTLGRAAERFPDHPRVYTAAGRVWLEAAERGHDAAALRKALEALEPIAARSDATSETLALYGRALLRAGNPIRAEEVLKLAVRRAPIEPSAFPDLATAARRLGHTATAADAEARHALLTGP